LYTLPINKVDFDKLVRKEIKINYSNYSYSSNYSSNNYSSGSGVKDYQYWKNDTVDEWVNRGVPKESGLYKSYDPIFDLYYTDTMKKYLDMWAVDNFEKYLGHYEEKKYRYSTEVYNHATNKIRILKKEIEEKKGKKENIDKDKEVSSNTNIVPFELNQKTDLTVPFGKLGKKCSVIQFSHKVKDGCLFCGNPVDTEDANYLYWVNEKEFLCLSCQWDAATKENHQIHSICDTTHLDSWVKNMSNYSH
jgi:hypothetical protein